MATRGKKKLAAETNSAASLIEALNFIAPAQSTKGDYPNFTHCVMQANRLTASDGMLTISTKIEEEIETIAHTLTLKLALSKCGQNMSMTQLDESKLTIRSESFKATVPCLEMDAFPIGFPDVAIAPLDNDKMKKGFALLGEILGFEKDKFISDCSIKLNSGSMIATNRFVVLEFWHGANFPPGLLLPKKFTDAVAKTKKKIVSFGFSESSFTIWFEDESYIKTQLFLEEFPCCEKILDVASVPWPLPPGFFKAIDTLAPFVGEDRGIYFVKNELRTEPEEDNGARIELPGVVGGLKYSVDFLKAIEGCCTKIDFSIALENHNKTALFFGENIRGAIAGYR